MRVPRVVSTSRKRFCRMAEALFVVCGALRANGRQRHSLRASRTTSALLPFTARSLPHAPKQIVSHLFWNCYMLIIHLRIIHYLPMKRFGFPQRAEKQSVEEALENS